MGLQVAGANLFLNGGLLNGSRAVELRRAAATPLTGRNYADVAIALANWRRIGTTGFYENSVLVDFPKPSSAWQTVTHWALKSGAVVLLIDPIDTGSAAPAANVAVNFPIGRLEVGMGGNVTPDGSVEGLIRGLLAGTRKLSVHSVDPTNPTSGLINRAVDITFGDFSVVTEAADVGASLPRRRTAINSSLLSLGVAETDPPRPVFAAISDGTASTDKILWKDEFDTEALDPDLGHVLSFGVGKLRIPITVD